MAQDRLIRGAAIVAIVATTLAVALTVGVLAVPSLRSRFVSTSAYAAGQTIDVAPRLYAARERTLVVFASASCPACIQSKPWLAKLAAEQGTWHGKAGMVLVMSSAMAEESRAFAVEVGLSTGDQLALVAVSSLAVRRVPTMVGVDSAGRIAYAYEGVLTDAAYAEAARFLRHSSERGD